MEPEPEVDSTGIAGSSVKDFGDYHPSALRRLTAGEDESSSDEDSGEEKSESPPLAQIMHFQKLEPGQNLSQHKKRSRAADAPGVSFQEPIENSAVWIRHECRPVRCKAFTFFFSNDGKPIAVEDFNIQPNFGPDIPEAKQTFQCAINPVSGFRTFSNDDLRRNFSCLTQVLKTPGYMVQWENIGHAKSRRRKNKMIPIPLGKIVTIDEGTVAEGSLIASTPELPLLLLSRWMQLS